MDDQEFLKHIATRAAHKLHMPLGEIDPLELILLYSSLSVLNGGDGGLMVHWLNTHNKHLRFNPAAHLTSYRHIKKINFYLEGLIG